MDKGETRSIQVHNNESNHQHIGEVLQRVNMAVLGLLSIAGLMCLTMKCSEPMFREALPAYLIVCCLLFFKAISQKQ